MSAAERDTRQIGGGFDCVMVQGVPAGLAQLQVLAGRRAREEARHRNNNCGYHSADALTATRALQL